MILGVGIDIIEVKRVENSIAKEMGFREKVFSAEEIKYCETNPVTRYQHYAARFAAKEAFLKATGKGLQLSHELNQIIVELNPDGKPTIVLSDPIKKQVSTSSFQVYVSLSHVELTACAVVVIETN